MTDLMSESQAAAEPCNGDPANDALSGAGSTDSAPRQTGRHRAAQESDAGPAKDTAVDADERLIGRSPDFLPPHPDQAVARALVAAKDPTRRSAVATPLAAGVGAAAFHAAIEAARSSASRQRVDRLDDEKTAETGQGRHTISAGS